MTSAGVGTFLTLAKVPVRFLWPFFSVTLLVRCTLYELPKAAGCSARKAPHKCTGDSDLKSSAEIFSKILFQRATTHSFAANVVHTLTAEQNRQLLSRVREAAAQGARFLLVDFWTNSTHTEPQIAALAAGEFLIIAGKGDVYSTEEAMMWVA